MSTSPTSRSRVQQVRDQLEDDIVNGRMRPGEQVQIEPLMVRFAVSRTPVREALQQLEISGLIEVLPKGGTFVAKVGIPELVHMFEVMDELGADATQRIELDVRALSDGRYVLHLIDGKARYAGSFVKVH